MASKLDGALESALDQVIQLEGLIEHVLAVELEKSSIAVEWREIGRVRIGLDAGGSAVRIELPDTLPGWRAE